jgi:hypothetical protein
MEKQPEALRLAERLTSPDAGPWDNHDAAAELRRLHAEVSFWRGMYERERDDHAAASDETSR